MILNEFISQATGHLDSLRDRRLRIKERRLRGVLRRFVWFVDNHDLSLRQMDSALIVRYEQSLHLDNLSRNTTSFYIRALRSLYNVVLRLSGVDVSSNPFRDAYTGIDTTRKRFLSLHWLQVIARADLSAHPRLLFARDLFLFSFYTRGMSFIDIAFLRKSDLSGDTLAYRRHKTGRLYTVRWEAKMQAILSRHFDPASPWLLPVINRPGVDPRLCAESRLRTINRHLLELSQLLQLPFPVTTYVARHSWANLARAYNIPLSVISAAMGHDSERTTRIYIDSIDNSVVDAANSRIIQDI